MTGSHLIVPNTNEELEFIRTSLNLSSVSTYWTGYQDFARRGAGSTSNANWTIYAAGYTTDPDGIWKPTDDVGLALGPNFIPVTGGYADTVNAPWLVWNSEPIAPINFIAHLEYFGADLRMVPGGDFYVSRSYVCEHSLACYSCPAGWVKFLDKCVKYYSTGASLLTAHSTCTSQSAYLITPRTEGTLIGTRAGINYLQVPIFIGLSKFTSIWSDNKWRWHDGEFAPNEDPSYPLHFEFSFSDGQEPTINDAFQLVGGKPSNTDNAIRLNPDNQASLTSIHIPTDGFTIGGLAVYY